MEYLLTILVCLIFIIPYIINKVIKKKVEAKGKQINLSFSNSFAIMTMVLFIIFAISTGMLFFAPSLEAIFFILYLMYLSSVLMRLSLTIYIIAIIVDTVRYKKKNKKEEN